MLEKLRGAAAPLLEGTARALAAASVKPWMLTALSLGAACAAGYAASVGVGGLQFAALVLLSGALDALDGALARVTGAVTTFGGLADAVSDRVGEVAILLGCAMGGLASAEVSLLALALSLLVSYVRARAESLGAPLAGVGLAERGERLLLIAASAAAGLLEEGLLLLSALCAVTVVQRVVEGRRALKSA